jgi:hypothetical protein
MQCEHKKLSDFHGLLRKTSIELYATEQNEYGGYVYTGAKETVNLASLIDPKAEEETLEILNQLDIEYIRLPEPQRYLDPPGGYWGVHEWMDSFSLILMIHFAGFFWYEDTERFEHTPLRRGLRQLDKMYLAVAQGKYALRS